MLLTFTGEVIQINKQRDFSRHGSASHKVDVVLSITECNGEILTKEYFRKVTFVNKSLMFTLYFKKGDIIKVHTIPLGFRFENEIGEYNFYNNDIVKLFEMVKSKKKKPKPSKYSDLSQYVEQEPIPEDFNNNNKV